MTDVGGWRGLFHILLRENDEVDGRNFFAGSFV
jgi:hypothetical protein